MRKIKIIFGLMIVLLSAGCYYDKEETLYPAGTCNSAGSTYSFSVSPILNLRCNSCHSAAAAPSSGGNIVLDNYNSVKIQANNSKLLGSIIHAGGFSPMPKGGAKLTSCEIARITNWVASGAPNN
jgi:uncharacterized membrane protein